MAKKAKKIKRAAKFGAALSALFALLIAVSPLVGCADGAGSDGTARNDGGKITTDKNGLSTDNGTSGDDGKTDNPDTLGYAADCKFPDEMPVLEITTEGGAAVKSKTEYVSGAASLTEPLGEYSFENLSLQIRCRGNWTYWGTGYDKKPYRLKFDEKINLLGLESGPSKNWVLLANFADHSMMRAASAFAAARVLSHISYVTPSAYVMLTLNGEELGVYQLCAQIQTGKYRIKTDESSEEVDCDYLIELDARAASSGDEGVDWFESGGRKFVIKNDVYSQDAADFLKDYFDRVLGAIESGDKTAVCELCDIDSFVDMYILQEFVKNPDVGWSSFYIVKKAGGKLYLTSPWDFDLALGNYIAYGIKDSSGLFVGNENYAALASSNPFFMGLCGCEWFADELVKERWEEVGEKMYNAAIGEIERIYSAYADEFEKNFEIWDLLGKSVYPCPDSVATIDTLDRSVNQLGEYIKERYEWLCGEFSGR